MRRSCAAFFGRKMLPAWSEVLCRGWSATCGGWAGCRWQAGDASVLRRGWLVMCGGCGRMPVAGRGCFGAPPGMVSAGCLAVVVVSPHSRSPSCRSTRPPPRSSAPPAKGRGEYARIYPNLRRGEAVEGYVGPVSPKGRGKNCRKSPNLRHGEAVEGYVGEVPPKGRGKNCRKFPNLRRGIICGDVRRRRFFGAESCLIFCTEKAGLPNKMVLQGHSVRENRGLPNGIALMAKVARREPSGPCRVGAESPKKAHTWTGATAADGAAGHGPGRQGRRPCQVGAESPEKAHTWTGQRPQTGPQGGPPCQVGAEMPEKAHTWTGQQAQGAAAGHGPGRQGSFRQITIFAA